MAKHKQILLKNIREKEQYLLAQYEKRDGYQAIRKALATDPLKIVEEVKASGLRGRGGAGFAAGVKWGFIPRNSPKPIYVVANADESEPGTFKDRLLMENDPHLFIEGMMITAWAVQAHWGCIYIRGEYAFPYSRLVQAVKSCYEKGYLGKNIFGSGFDFDLVVHRGAGAYICGEETALLSSLEGKKGQPRIKPPFFPAAIGLYNAPTVVNNVETFSAVPWIISNGGAEYAKIGVGKSTGTKLFSASGHINKPGVYEVEMGYPLLQFIEDECGGIKGGKKLKGVIPGGSSMPVLRADELQGVTLDYESIQKAGSSLGSGGFIVMDETTDIVQVANNIARFYAHESCGQCTPCREGGHWIQKIFRRIEHGEGLPGDPELIQSITSQVEGHTICVFGEAFSWPAKAWLRKFPEEFKARIKEAVEGTFKPRPSINFEDEGAHH